MPRSVRLLTVARAVNRLGAFSMSFLTVLITTSFGASPPVAGYVSAAFGLATVPSRLVGGRLADRIGRRRTIVVGLTGCAVAQLGLAAADSLTLVICCAVLLGLVFELYEPPSQAMIADVVAPRERVRAYSLLNAALAAAGMGAGLIAAGLGRWGLRWLFVVDALTCLLCALTVQLVLPADHHTAKTATPEQGISVAPWRDGALLLLLATGTLFAAIYLQIMITLPLAMDHEGLQPADAGLLFTASAVTICAGQPLMSWSRLSALSTPAAFAAGYLLLALGLGGYALAHTLVGYLAATVVWSVGDLLLVGRVYAVVAELAPAGGKGRYLAVYGTSWGIAGITAPVMGTQLIEHAGPAGLWSAMSLACLLLAALQPAVVRQATPHGDGGQRQSVPVELPDRQLG
ncbi:MFS transporter [Streptomyces sp. NBC_01800]|uniref:MFS transporter n=1 Tax=Streptomyces sp. NBC_01800 TaxID=2975945 RepID=UPI002DD852FA|nr:MFS transporter [Streptomyces sp. NBC_01800]WSA73238.1 MFS transporter [Streptomyces sp. NBC_01800]